MAIIQVRTLAGRARKEPTQHRTEVMDRLYVVKHRSTVDDVLNTIALTPQPSTKREQMPGKKTQSSYINMNIYN